MHQRRAFRGPERGIGPLSVDKYLHHLARPRSGEPHLIRGSFDGL